MGPNYLRFGLAYSTDFQGETTSRCWSAIGASGSTASARSGSTRSSSAASPAPQPSSTSRSILAQNMFVSAYGSAQNIPRYVFSGSQRVAEYRVETNTAGLDVGLPIGDSGDMRVGPQYTFYKGTPTVAVPGFPTTRQTDAVVRLLARWDNLDNAFFPHRGLRSNLDVSYGERTQRTGSDPDEVSKRARPRRLLRQRRPRIHTRRFHQRRRARGRPFARRPFARQSVPAGRVPQPFRAAQWAARRQLPGLRAASSTTIASPGCRSSAATSSPAARSRPATPGSSATRCRAGDLVKAGSLFLAADTFLGPFYVAYGRASGGASSFYLFLGRP